MTCTPVGLHHLPRRRRLPPTSPVLGPRMRAELLALADHRQVDLDAGVLPAAELLRESVAR